MSINLVGRLLFLPIPPKQKLILIAMADCAKDNGVCWPSLEMVGIKASCGKRTASRHITDAVDKGWVQRRQRKGADGRQQATVYRIVIDKIESDLPSSVGQNGPRSRGPKSDEPWAIFGDTVGQNDERNKEEPSVNRKRTVKAHHPLPDDFEPNANNLETATQLGLQMGGPTGELARFKDFHRARGSEMANWHFALNTWLRNSSKFNQRPGSGSAAAAPTRYKTGKELLAEQMAEQARPQRQLQLDETAGGRR